jgi:type II secretory pathway predicted ATPase ExeA
MYAEHYGFREKPFALSPDPRYLFLSASHREVLGHLVYGIEQGEGFMAISGEVGTGKTTLCRTLLERLGSSCEIAFLFNPTLEPTDLIKAINGEFGLSTYGDSRAELLDVLNTFLLDRHAEGRRVLVIIDEAQNLPIPTLEQLRLLSNLETHTAKLLQIVLIGQPDMEKQRLDNAIHIPKMLSFITYQRWDAQVKRARLACPMRALASRDDPIVPVSMTEAIWQDTGIDWSRDGGHVLPLRHPRWCARHVLDFAASL